MFLNVNNCSTTLNSEHDSEDLCIKLRNQQHALIITITNSGEIGFQSNSCICSLNICYCNTSFVM